VAGEIAPLIRDERVLRVVLVAYRVQEGCGAERFVAGAAPVTGPTASPIVRAVTDGDVPVEERDLRQLSEPRVPAVCLREERDPS